uniref:Uncharacterized protein n=1 Tax=Oryza brachyantha TaxID=4533 RepID=J3MER1_ORYBR
MAIDHTRLECLIFNCLDLGGCGLQSAVSPMNSNWDYTSHVYSVNYS